MPLIIVLEIVVIALPILSMPSTVSGSFTSLKTIFKVYILPQLELLSQRITALIIVVFLFFHVLFCVSWARPPGDHHFLCGFLSNRLFHPVRRRVWSAIYHFTNGFYLLHHLGDLRGRNGAKDLFLGGGGYLYRLSGAVGSVLTKIATMPLP